ncbi:MAG: ATP-binding cassette domain-containing protein [Termitinemataceae bacterium]|jgi:energy-coupling factor transport system ATP-binding protein|nr:MAG: ATP-binding cassette domain-containing protein [Termitinemataceae bacterium]
MALIELKNVTYKYPLSKKPALRNLNYEFEEGVFYGLIGENGGGKTSLCCLIRGLIPHFYNGILDGETLVFGKDIKEHTPEELSVKIGYVFQNPFNQISGIKETVFEEIAMGLENLGVPKKDMIEKVLSVCELLKIEALIQKNPNELSGGQRQRVAFASIIAMENKILVIDEPTSQLDPQGTEDVFEIIKTLKASGKTIILVEHKIDLIAQYCEKVIVMEKGEIVRAGDTGGILADISLLEKGADIPQVAVWGNDMRLAQKPLDYIPITVAQGVELAKKRG